MRTINLLAFVAIISGGCVVVHDNGGGGGGGVGGGGGGGPVQPPTYHIDPNASTTVSPGTQAGYGITANFGGSYRMVWTGDSQISGQYSEFRGTIYTPGTFTAFDPGCGGGCPDEPNDVINPPEAVVGGGEQITFDTIATDGLDGLDFGVDLEPVTFDIQIDNDYHPELVLFPSGGVLSSPSVIPFGLTTN